MAVRGQTVLVTGAAGGIGAAVAREVHGHGANVVVTDLDQAKVDALAAELGGERALALSVDVTNRASLDAAIAASVERFGGVDVVFANAGIASDRPRTVAATPDEVFERVVGVDLHGVWNTVKAALPQVIERRGYVLITSSTYAFVNGLVNAPYTMSKAAVEQLGRALRVELASTGASAGVLFPGWIDTPIAAVALTDEGPAKELVAHAFPGPLGKGIAPERVARAVRRGIERRRARIVVPRIWAPVSLLRGVVAAVHDPLLARDEEVARLVREVDAAGG